jgi:hypothetical protein
VRFVAFLTLALWLATGACAGGVDAQIAVLLGRFVGKWEGSATSRGVPAACTRTFTWEAGNHALLTQYREVSGGYSGVGMLTYDISQKRFRYFWCDSGGGIADAHGAWVAGNSLVFTYRSGVGATDHAGRLSFTFQGTDRLSQKLERRAIGKAWKTVMTAEFKRPSGSRAAR